MLRIGTQLWSSLVITYRERKITRLIICPHLFPCGLGVIYCSGEPPSLTPRFLSTNIGKKTDTLKTKGEPERKQKCNARHRGHSEWFPGVGKGWIPRVIWKSNEIMHVWTHDWHLVSKGQGHYASCHTWSYHSQCLIVHIYIHKGEKTVFTKVLSFLLFW